MLQKKVQKKRKDAAAGKNQKLPKHIRVSLQQGEAFLKGLQKGLQDDTNLPKTQAMPEVKPPKQ